MVVGGFLASGATPWFVFFFFSVPSSHLATSKRVSKEVRTLAILSLPASATSNEVSVLELDGIYSQMAGG